MKCIQIIVRGQVEKRGMAFRAMSNASKYEISGQAKYLDFDRLLIDAEGKEVQLKGFLSWCSSLKLEQGISEVVFNESSLKKYTQFEIRNTGII